MSDMEPVCESLISPVLIISYTVINRYTFVPH